MDLHHTPSSTPHYNAKRPPSGSPEPASSGTLDPTPGSDAWLARRVGEEQALHALEAEITQLWGHINAATAHFLSLVAEFDRREGWAQHGIGSCAHWLSWQCGISRVAAREKVRVARALESLPKIQAAFGKGELSYSKVRAITRWASEETEDTLLRIASSGTAAHVERTVRGFRRVKRHLERNEAEAVYEGRYLDCRRMSDGSVTVEARLTPEVGEMLLKALEAAEAQLEDRGGGNERSEGHGGVGQPGKRGEVAGRAEDGGSDKAQRDERARDADGSEDESGEAQRKGRPGDVHGEEPAVSASSACGGASAETSGPPAVPRQRREAAPEGASAEAPSGTAPGHGRSAGGEPGASAETSCPPSARRQGGGAGPESASAETSTGIAPCDGRRAGHAAGGPEVSAETSGTQSRHRPCNAAPQGASAEASCPPSAQRQGQEATPEGASAEASSGTAPDHGRRAGQAAGEPGASAEASCPRPVQQQEQEAAPESASAEAPSGTAPGHGRRAGHAAGGPEVSAETFGPRPVQQQGREAASESASAEAPSGTAPGHGCSAGGRPGASAETSGPPAVPRQRREAGSEGASAEAPPRSISQRRADAFEHIVQQFLAGNGSRSGAGAHELVVHIAHDALQDVPESSGATLDDGRSVAVETARRLGCDGALVGVVEGKQGEPLAVGRRTRAVPPAIRRALRVRDGGCRFPGCDRSRYVHAHHIRHWADGGETNLDNLVTLCSRHHRLVHEGGYGVGMKEGEIEFTRPDGRVIPPVGPAHKGCFRGSACAKSGDTCAKSGSACVKSGNDCAKSGSACVKSGSACVKSGSTCAESGSACAASGAQRLAAINKARGLDIDADTARCRWGGERMDYNIAIDALCWEAGYR